MAVIISKTEINWGDAFFGFVPSKTVFQSGGLYTCECLSRSPRVDGSIVLTLNALIAAIGIIGATVMPHSLFLGSALATQDRVASSPRQSASRDADASDEGALPSVRNARTLTLHIFIKESPFRLAFRTEAMIPLDSGLPSLRAEQHDLMKNEATL